MLHIDKHTSRDLAATAGVAEPGYAVEMLSISKHFGSLVANNNVTLRVKRGEVHALLGENGAGKSTLMNMLYGLLSPDGGRILIDGVERSFRSPNDAKLAGVGMVHQHYMLVPTLTPLQNILLAERDKFVLSADYVEGVRRKLQALIEKYGLTVKLDAPVWQLSVGEQQRVEILRTLYNESKVLILDEPTAMLTPSEVEQLFLRLRVLVAEGTSIIIISHHLDDVLSFADRITVLRGGENVRTLSRDEADATGLAKLMVGNDAISKAGAWADQPVKPDRGAGEIRLAVDDLCALGDRGETVLDGMSFEVRSGEIVAIAGVSGNGQSELEEVLFGLRQRTRGKVSLAGDDITGRSPAHRVKAGMAYIPSDRYRYGLVRNMAVASNLIFDRLDVAPFGSAWKLSMRSIQSYARDMIDRFAIRVKSPQTHAGTLSGGNAQRVVLARAMSRDITTLIAAQPARGLDVGAVSFVWEKLNAAREKGIAVLLISTELEEVFALADRCYVIYRGKLIGHWHRHELDRETIGLALGGVCQAEEPAVSPREKCHA